MGCQFPINSLKSLNLMWQVVGYVGLGLKRPFWKLHVKFANLHADLTPPIINELIFFLNSV